MTSRRTKADVDQVAVAIPLHADRRNFYKVEDWSEHVNERRVRHAWSCNVCGYEFETTVFYPEK